MANRMTDPTPSPTTRRWADFRSEQPGFADTVSRRFGAFRHHVLATLRADGSPRLTGLEAVFRAGELWLGMMVGSRKATDLRRDPRFSLHANPGPGTDMAGGDVRVSGRAEEVTDAQTRQRYLAGADEGHPEVFLLFRAELTEAVRVHIAGEQIVLETWHPGRPLHMVRRGNDDAAPCDAEGPAGA